METFLSTHTQTYTHTQTHMYVYIHMGIDSLVPKVIAQVVPEVNKRGAIPGLGWGGSGRPNKSAGTLWIKEATHQIGFGATFRLGFKKAPNSSQVVEKLQAMQYVELWKLQPSAPACKGQHRAPVG